MKRRPSLPKLPPRLSRPGWPQWLRCLPLLMLALLPTLAHANLCPNQMEIKLPKASDTPPGWERLPQNVKPPLTRVQLFDGPPDAAPEIKPKPHDSAHNSPHQHTHLRWEFRIASKQGPISAAADNTNPGEGVPVRPLWIKCSYGNLPITLLRPLPIDFSACTLKCAQGCQLWCQ
jgi:hypothetical protein